MWCNKIQQFKDFCLIILRISSQKKKKFNSLLKNVAVIIQNNTFLIIFKPKTVFQNNILMYMSS